MIFARSFGSLPWRTLGQISIFLPLKKVLEGFYSSPGGDGTTEGFGPVSKDRTTDFTPLFEDRRVSSHFHICMSNVF